MFEFPGKPGAFLLYAVLGLAGLVLFFFRLPETSGLSLEETETLFLRPGEEAGGTRKGSSTGANFSVAYSRISNPLDADD